MTDEHTEAAPEETAVSEPTALEELEIYLRDALGDLLSEAHISHEELRVVVPAASLLRVLAFLRDDQNCLFTQLSDLCGVDYPDEDPRFEVVYNLLGMKHNHRIRVVVRTNDDTPVPSVIDIYPVAGWFERECWDLYGVFFDGNPDLRRILTDYGFEGHPLRKDFPLTGFVEMRYDEARKRVVYEPVQLTQDFRSFDFLSPWEGMTDVQLPGDEKANKPFTGHSNPAQSEHGGA